MLSERLIQFFKEKKWWFDDIEDNYKQALLNIGVDIESDFSIFYLHVEDNPTFMSRNREIYQICWFLLNTNDYMLGVKRTHETLKLPVNYIPLDNFAGDYGYFYNKDSGAVLCLGLGKEWHDFMNGILEPQWDDFNSFLEWFFELDK
ncbi:hypothetical protein CHU32_14300 [Superficieibacter electus]|uniref:SMI1/KNR4 family protein n=1 Tax=Superficieibacter electus TaxID=2022662 RepID=A0A2P5GN89_9ENTR|nr:hypothetical protein [Superficieibacter electus]POP43550.1 hypothetical protein CHU33_15010 [Superficieibacter electus]POP48018.1 hypothetical protein CHU32_14300 [Superficieibacter electus]